MVDEGRPLWTSLHPLRASLRVFCCALICKIHRSVRTLSALWGLSVRTFILAFSGPQGSLCPRSTSPDRRAPSCRGTPSRRHVAWRGRAASPPLCPGRGPGVRCSGAHSGGCRWPGLHPRTRSLACCPAAPHRERPVAPGRAEPRSRHGGGGACRRKVLSHGPDARPPSRAGRARSRRRGAERTRGTERTAHGRTRSVSLASSACLPLSLPAGMGLLSQGSPLSWEETRRYAEHVRRHGILQFLHIYRALRDRHKDVLKWGDEVGESPASAASAAASAPPVAGAGAVPVRRGPGRSAADARREGTLRLPAGALFTSRTRTARRRSLRSTAAPLVPRFWSARTTSSVSAWRHSVARAAPREVYSRDGDARQHSLLLRSLFMLSRWVWAKHVYASSPRQCLLGLRLSFWEESEGSGGGRAALQWQPCHRVPPVSLRERDLPSPALSRSFLGVWYESACLLNKV